MKQIETNGQYFEKLTSRREAAKYIKDIKNDCVWGDVDDGLYPDNSLFIEYLDGTIIILSEGDAVKGVRTSNIKTMILDADWGTAFYNAFPQLDEEYPDFPIIRIGTECGEYGNPIDI